MERAASASSGIDRIPLATYRLQFNERFTFEQAEAVLEYLSELHVSDCYASPLFQPRAGSTHGYDVCCFNTLNRALGSEEDFARFATCLRQRRLGLLLDIVPNHMGADLSNQWWFDVLEKGRASRFAEYFDINWSECTPGLANRLLLPVLGNHLGKVVQKGEIKLAFDGGGFVFDYYGKKYPASLATYRELLSPLDDSLEGKEAEHVRTLLDESEQSGRMDKLKDGLAAFFKADGGFADALNNVLQRCNADKHGSAELSRLLDLQHYRLAYWKVGSEELNYRRFFDVTELVSVKMERNEVFHAAHQLVAELLKKQVVTGLRVDHPDGLWDPKEYFIRLQGKSAETTGGTSSKQLYIVAEKILSDGEELPGDWPVDGTTGYDYLNDLNGVFVHTSNVRALDDIYRSFAPQNDDFSAIVSRSKRKILTRSLISEVSELAYRLKAVAASERWRRDFTFSQLRDAIVEVIVSFPVYRTYVTADAQGLSPADQTHLEIAFAEAKKNSAVNAEALDLLNELLALRSPAGQQNEEERTFVMKFQQLTGPATAKGIEDTSFYIYQRLVSLNEVGGLPERFGLSVAEFHERNENRAKRWPHSLLATATHDTKRGEDVRARINVLSELSEEWNATAQRWRGNNAGKKQNGAPDANDEYLLYQTLVGAFPDDGVSAEFEERITAYMLKAIKESKEHTSWVEPNTAYEEGMKHFVHALFADKTFISDLQQFAKRIAYFGRLNSLSQTLLKLTSPGVPDIYQGCELWDLSLVDPDNRRPVDFATRKQMLGKLKERSQKELPQLARGLLDHAVTGGVKMFTILQALRLRQEKQTLFTFGNYVPLKTDGLAAEHLCAFVRQHGDDAVVIVAPRLFATLMKGREALPLGAAVWGNTTVELSASLQGQQYVNVFTGNRIPAEATADGKLSCASLFSEFPLALLKRVD